MSAPEFDLPDNTARVVERKNETPDHRRIERASTDLKTIVQVKESADLTWKEVTKVTTVSRNGVGFGLKRSVSVGRLVNLILPMPREFRAYDEDADVYQCVGIVQHCNKSTIDGETVFHVGIALIGKEVPESFKIDPGQNYRITGMRADGFWEIAESANEFKKRSKPRYWLSLPVTITLIQREEKSMIKEDSFTQNIGAGGVSVSSTLNANVGDKVKFACKPVDFYAIAFVRNRKKVDEHNTTLHLEFEGSQFPMEKIMMLQKTAA